MQVLVTRVQPQAQAWCERLRQLGLNAVPAPLIDIQATDHPEAVQQAWRDLAGYDWAVFVSPSAIRGFFLSGRDGGRAWPASTRVALPGPGSEAAYVQAMREAGLSLPQVVRPAEDAQQLDSEHLWLALQEAASWRGARVLMVGGADEHGQVAGREWLSQRLTERGALVEHLSAYRRCPPKLDGELRRVLTAALSEPTQHLWLFSSSLAIDYLQQLISTQALPAISAQARALATHPKIAQRAREAGMGQVVESLPTFAAVSHHIAALQLQAAAS